MDKFYIFDSATGMMFGTVGYDTTGKAQAYIDTLVKIDGLADTFTIVTIKAARTERTERERRIRRGAYRAGYTKRTKMYPADLTAEEIALTDAEYDRGVLYRSQSDHEARFANSTGSSMR